MVMASLDDVRRLALTMPEATEVHRRDGLVQWKVKDKLFVWERPLRGSDIAALGDDAPGGMILGARVPDEGAKRALIASDPDVYFTTPHFDGYPAVLVRLDEIGLQELEELVVEAWLHRAPPKLAASYRGE
jgi:hypothetical protein